jgi:hypothetical protein
LSILDQSPSFLVSKDGFKIASILLCSPFQIAHIIAMWAFFLALQLDLVKFATHPYSSKDRFERRLSTLD